MSCQLCIPTSRNEPIITSADPRKLSWGALGGTFLEASAPGAKSSSAVPSPETLDLSLF